MRFLTTCFFLLLTAIATAQCSFSTNILQTYCLPDSSGWMVELEVTAPGDTIEIAAIDFEGFVGGTDTFTVGPFAPASLGQFLVRDLNFAEPDCSEWITPPAPSCPEFPCFGFLIFVDQELEDAFCGQPAPRRFRARNADYPVYLEVSNAVNEIVGLDTINAPNDDVVLFLPEGSYSYLATDAGSGEECLFTGEFFASSDEACINLSVDSWFDENENGLREDNEPAFQDLTGFLYFEGQVVDQQRPNSFGRLFFDVVTGVGDYFIEFIPDSASFKPTIMDAGTNDFEDSDVDPTTNRTPNFFIFPGDFINYIDVGWVPRGCDIELNTYQAGRNSGCLPDSFFVEVTAPEYPVSLNLAQSGSPGRTFSATSASRVPFNMSRTGVYTLTATGPNNCTVERQVFLGSSGSIAIEIIQDGNGCEGPITLTALVSGSDTTGLTYNWSTGATEPTIVVDLVPGERENISVVVTSETGCINDAGISLAVDSLIDLRLPRVTEIPCGQDTATLIVPEPLPDYTYTWFGPLNQMLVGDSVRVTMTGWYEVVGQDNSGEACGYFGRTRVTDPNLPDGLFLEQFGSDSICGGQECFGVAGLANIDYEAVAFEWDGPAGFEASTDPPLGPFLCTTIPGDYTLTILGPCDTITLSYTYESQSCSLLSGTLWMDNAGNCALDSEDIPAPNFLIGLTEETSGRTYYTFTNGMGEWSLEVPIGTYLIEPVIQEGQPFTTCPNPTRVSLGDLPVSGVDLFLPVLVGCPQLSTSVSLPFLRRCFTNYVFIDYENTGSAVAEDAELTVTLDDFFLDAEPNIPPTNQDGQTYTFSLGDLPPFTNGRIFFLFRLSCQAQLGQAHCVEAAITPDAACLPDPNWSGALVDVTGSTCDGDSLYFQIENIGDGPMTIPLNYVVVEDGIMLSTEPIVNGILAIGEVMEVGVPAEGSTYLIITNQEPNAPGATQPTAVAEGCGTNANGEVTLGLANLWALNAGNPARTVECRENVGAYDPNDKTAIPTGYDDGNIPYGTRLTYDIRFQNTGTDTAFTVVIRDTISEALDLSTIKFEGASHPVSMSLDTHRVLTFTFENIQLPDSSVNLAASQGVVQFSIDHDSTLLRGSVINNEAAIYFDFNAPIITNISRRRIAKNGLPVGVHTPGILDLSVSVFPNPVDGRLFVKLPIEEMKTTDQLTVIDLYGRPLLSVPYGQSGNGLAVDGLPAGYYLLVVADASGRARGRAGFVKR